MSSSRLSIKIKYLDQPAASDSLERLTAAELQVSTERNTITRVWDKQTKRERTQIFVPILPIAEWIVENWWALLNEPCPAQYVPVGEATLRNLPWVKRHNMRSADSSLALPALYLFSDGEIIGMQWASDSENSYSHTPTQFMEYGRCYLSRTSVIDSLASLVNNVLDRIKGHNSDRANELKLHWEAIQTADEEETDFCILAGRMGLNPYDGNETTDEVANAICAIEGDPDFPLVRDLTEATTADVVASQWSWVQKISTELNLHRIPEPVQKYIDIPKINRRSPPYSYGYEMARLLREQADLPKSAPVDSVEEIALRLSGKPLRIEQRNHLVGQGIRGIVGWSGDEAIVAGPNTGFDNSRFLLARGLFHALDSCDVSQRLVTKAFTWDQSAGRSFAAEFLAPQQALVARTGNEADAEVVESLAKEYQVSPMVITNQLSNAHVELVSQ